MRKVIPLEFESAEFDDLKSILAKKQLSYVLITCTEPSEEGEMDVEMDYAGDPVLLSMLMENARERLDYS